MFFADSLVVIFTAKIQTIYGIIRVQLYFDEAYRQQNLATGDPGLLYLCSSVV